jgi:hypothetical protein
MVQTSPDHHLISSKEKQSTKSKTSGLINDLGKTKSWNISSNGRATQKAITHGNQWNNCMLHKSLKGIMQSTHWRG